MCTGLKCAALEHFRCTLEHFKGTLGTLWRTLVYMYMYTRMPARPYARMPVCTYIPPRLSRWTATAAVVLFPVGLFSAF